MREIFLRDSVREFNCSLYGDHPCHSSNRHRFVEYRLPLMSHSLLWKTSFSKAFKGNDRTRAMHSKTTAGLKPAS